MLAETEPRTLEEMNARVKAARARQEDAAKRVVLKQADVKVIRRGDRPWSLQEAQERARRLARQERIDALAAAAAARAREDEGLRAVLCAPECTVAFYLETVSLVSNVPLFQILSDRRDGDVVKARQLVMWLAYRFTGRSYPQIGRALDRDHTSVLNGVRKIDRIVDQVGSPGENTPKAWAEHLWRAEWPYSGGGRPDQRRATA